jgi:hypothetical protein
MADVPAAGSVVVADAPGVRRTTEDDLMSTNPMKNKNTAAFFTQAAIAFGVSSVGLMIGIAYLPLDIWQRLFLGMTGLFVITSAFTLAKVIRDAQEGSTVISRLDEARLERLLAEHDPYRAQQL